MQSTLSTQQQNTPNDRPRYSNEIKEGYKIFVGVTTRTVRNIYGVLCAVSDDFEGAHYMTVAEYLQFAKDCGFDVRIEPS